MKKLTKKELGGLKFKLQGKNGRNMVLEEVKKLDVGEVLLVEKKDWLVKTPVGVSIGGSTRDGRKFSTRTLDKDKGWVVTRIK